MATCLPTACVTTSVSGIIGYPIEDAWNAVKDWGDWGAFGIRSSLMDGANNHTIGALRKSEWGPCGRIVERLTGYDIGNHSQRSRLISHRDNVNPFGASFLNYVTALKLTEVTIDASTFVEMEGSFETDLQEADAMHDNLSACYEARIRGLQATLCASACVEPHSPVALRKQPSAHVACGWHSDNSNVSRASTLTEQQAVAAAVQAAAATAAAAEALAAQKAAYAQQAAQLEEQRRALRAEEQAARQAEAERAQAAAAAAQRAEEQAQRRAALLQAQQQAAMAALAASHAMLDAPRTAYLPACSAAQAHYADAAALQGHGQAYGHAVAVSLPYAVAQAPAAACQVDLLAAAHAQAQAAYGALIASQAMLVPATPHAEPAMSTNPYPVSTPGKLPLAPTHASPTFCPAVPGGFVPARPEMSDNSGGGNSSGAEPGSPCKLRSW